MAELPPMVELELQAIEYNNSPPKNALLQSKELIKFYELKKDKLLQITRQLVEVYTTENQSQTNSIVDDILMEKRISKFEFNKTENTSTIDGFDRINCENNVISGLLVPFKRDFDRQIFYDYTEKKYIKLDNIIDKSDKDILNYLNNLFNKLYNTNIEPVLRDYSNTTCKCENKVCSLYKDLDQNIDDIHKLLLYNVSFLSQSTINIVSDMFTHTISENMTITNKITIFDKENKTLSIVALIKFREYIIGKIILCFDTSKIFRFARVLIEFNFNNENGKTDFMKNMETYISNIKNVTENVNIIRCLSSGNSKLDDNFKTVRESAGEQAHMKLLGTKGKKVLGSIGRDITRFHEKDCSGYYVPVHSTINKVKKGSKNSNLHIPFIKDKIGRETSYRGDNINICTQNKRLNFLYDPDTAQLQDLSGIYGDRIAMQISNLYTDFKNTSFIMILVADTIAINKLCGKTISPLDFIEINGKRKNLYKKENNYTNSTEFFTADKFNIEDYQYIYIINEPEFSTIPGVLDPPISIAGIRDLNSTILAIKKLYLDVDRIIPMIVASSYLSRSILTATIIGKEMQTYIDPNTHQVFFEEKYKNIEYIYKLFMYICIMRNLIIEYIYQKQQYKGDFYNDIFIIEKIDYNSEFFNEIYLNDIIDSYYSNIIKNFRENSDLKYLFDKEMKPEQFLTELGFVISNYNKDERLKTEYSRKLTKKASTTSKPRKLTKKSITSAATTEASGANEYNNNNIVIIPSEEERLVAEEAAEEAAAQKIISNQQTIEDTERAKKAQNAKNAIRAGLIKADKEEYNRLKKANKEAQAQLKAEAKKKEAERLEAVRREAERQEALRLETERLQAETARQEAEAAREKEEKEKAMRLEDERIEAEKQKAKQIADQIYYIKRDLEQKQDELMSLRTDLGITTTNLTDAIKKNLKEESKIKTTKITDINAGIHKTEKEIANLKETLRNLSNTGNSNTGNSTAGGFRKRSKKYNNKNNKKNNKTKTYKIKYINKHKKTNRKYKGKTSKK